MNTKAIFTLYPDAVRVAENEDGSVLVNDSEGNLITIDEAAVNAWVDPNAYQTQRASAYPSIQEQLDMQYWDSVNGTTTWADAIAKVKADYPKGGE